MPDNISHKCYGNRGNNDVLNSITGSGRILDIGCGVGDNAKILQQRGFEVDGITISEKELREAQPYLKKGFLCNAESGLPEDIKANKYDYVICSHVLEHICYPEKVLNDIRACLADNGKLIVALPNLFHYNSRWELMKGNFNYRDCGVWDNTHFKWYTFKTGALLLEENGFRITYKTVTGMLPGASLLSKIMTKKIAQRLYDKIKNLSPGLLGYQLLYVAVRK